MKSSSTPAGGGGGGGSGIAEPSFPLLPLPPSLDRGDDGSEDGVDGTPPPLAEGSESSSSEEPPWSSHDEDNSSSREGGGGASVGKVVKLLSKKKKPRAGALKKIGRAASGGSGGSGGDRPSSEPPPPAQVVVVRRGGPPRRDSVAPGGGGGGGRGKRTTVRSRRKKKKRRNSLAATALATPSSSSSAGKPKLERINSARLTALHRATTEDAPRPTASSGGTTASAAASAAAAARRSDPELALTSNSRRRTGDGSGRRRPSRVGAFRFGESRFETFMAVGAPEGTVAGGGPSTRMGSLCADSGDEDESTARLRELTLPGGRPAADFPPPTASSSSAAPPPPPPPPPRILPHSGGGGKGGGAGSSKVGTAVGRSVARGWKNAKKKASKKKSAKQRPRFDLSGMEGRSGADRPRPSPSSSRGSSEDGSVTSVDSSASSMMRGGIRTREELLHDAKLKFNLGKVYVRTGHPGKAKEALNKALRARMMLFGVDSVQVGEVHELLGDLAAQRGKVEVSRRHYKAALRMLDADWKKREKESKKKQVEETESERVLRIATRQGRIHVTLMDEIAVMRERVEKSLAKLPPPSDDSSGDASSVASCGLPTLAPRKSRGNPNQSVKPAMTADMRTDLTRLEKFLAPPPEEAAEEEAQIPPPPPALTPAGLKKSSSYTDFEAERRSSSGARWGRGGAVRQRSMERSGQIDEEDGPRCGDVLCFVVDPRRHQSRNSSTATSSSSSRRGGNFCMSSLTMTDVSTAAGGGDDGARTQSGARGGFRVSSMTATDFPAAGGDRARTESGPAGPSTDRNRRHVRDRGNASSDLFATARESGTADDEDSAASDPVGEKEKVESRRKSMSSSHAAMYRALAGTAASAADDDDDTNDDDADPEEDSTGLSESERYWNIEPDERETMPKVRFSITDGATTGPEMREASRSAYDERRDRRGPRDIYRSGLAHAQRGSFRSASLRFRRILDGGSAEDDGDGRRRGSEATEVVPLVLNSLGNIRFQQGEYEASIDLYKESLRGRMDQVDDPDHRREIAVTIANVGKAYLELGDFDGAVRCFKRSVKMLWTSKAEDRETVVAFLVGMLGTAHYQKGEYETAMKYFVKSVNAKKKMLKDESHPEILISRRDVGLCLFQLGRLEESLELFERLLAEWTNGDDDVDRASAGVVVDRDAEIALLLLDMAEVHLEWGGAKHTADASELLDASLQLMDAGAGMPPDDDDNRRWRSRAKSLSFKLEARQ